MISGVVISGASVTSVRPAAKRRQQANARPRRARATCVAVVHALALDVEERPFDVDTEHAGHAGLDSADGRKPRATTRDRR